MKKLIKNSEFKLKKTFDILVRDENGYFLKEDLEKLSVNDILENLMSGGFSQELSNLIRMECFKEFELIINNNNNKQ